MKYIIDSETLQGLADALRSVTGETRTYTPVEMIEEVSTILEKGIYLLTDENGTEIPAVFVENEVVFTATANDIRLGTIAATEEGVTTGTKEIPAYHTTEGFAVVPSGSEFTISINRCEFTKLQAIVCPFNTCIDDSVAAEKVSINGKVYPVNSSESVATVSSDINNKTINLGVINNTDDLYIMRYFTYKEEY